jgi:hypothetical protein
LKPAFGIVCVLLLPCSALVLADDDVAVEDDSQRCVNARSIRSADVIDDNHVVFHLQGRRILLNALPKTCVGLSRDRRFSYETYTRSLCARDKIRILKEAGDGFYEGRACSLGRFQPITEEELADYFKDRSVPRESQEPESADVEEVVSEERRL